MALQQPAITDTNFAVVDVETTGLHPFRSDRIVEIALLRVDYTGQVLRTFESLIDPQRDKCGSEIHGISSEELCQAPTFGDLIGDIYELLRGAIIVGHNVQFDASFLIAEANRLQLPPPQLPLLCTTELMRGIESSAFGRSLAACCQRLQIPFEPRHRAAEDARVTSEVFRICTERCIKNGAQTIADLGVRRRIPRFNEWPKTMPSGRSLVRQNR